VQKWEYCVVRGNYYWLSDGYLEKMTDKGREIVSDFTAILKNQPKGTKLRPDAVAAQTIAQLGEEGWELVGIHGGDASSEVVLYFKRPKQ